MNLRQIKAFAVDIDGVIVKDTFSPVIKIVIEKLGGSYSSEVEKNIFSRPQITAAKFLVDYLKTDIPPEEIIKFYFRERDIYIKENPDKCGLADGVDDFLELLASYNLRMVCYGGLGKEYFLKACGSYSRFFEEYICTNDFRPGIAEIIKKYFMLKYSEVVFFDDVNTVALEAKKLGVPFIGIPSRESFSFQKIDMQAAGIGYIVDSIKEINVFLLEKIAAEYFNIHSSDAF
jgi:beta-phosphoglucomutase-like phosphatase (HAD superfamily)